MFLVNTFVLVLCIGASFSDPIQSIVPCHKNDHACMTTSAKATLPIFATGFPDFGVESSDPLILNEIIGDLSTLKYKFTDTIVTGLKNCDVHDVKLDLDNSHLHYELTCKNVVMRGQYIIGGKLFVLPVEGKGAYEIHCKKYEFVIDADVKLVKGNDGTQHLAIKKYKFTSDAQEGIVYDFKNLFNGQKDLAETVLKFANQNWKEVANFVQEPAVVAVIKKITENLNKFLKIIPVDKLVLN